MTKPEYAAHLAPVSAAELIDRHCIMSLKSERASSLKAKESALRALEWMSPAVAPMLELDAIQDHVASLRAANSQLWYLEEQITDLLSEGATDQALGRVAREVFGVNASRALAKTGIDQIFGGPLSEDKTFIDVEGRSRRPLA